MKHARTIEEIGQLVKFHRMKQGRTQSDLARESGVSQEFISKLENGRGGNLQTFLTVMNELKLQIKLDEIERIDTDDLAKMMGN